MNKKNILFAASTAIFLFSGFIKKDTDIYFEINKSIDIFGKVYREVTLNYVEPLNPQEFMLAGIEGMLQSLDPYTNFIDQDNQKDIDIITKGKYGGIGATIGLRNESITIVDLIEGYSAQRQGMRIGDVIVKIGDVLITKDNYDEMNELLKGDPGTTIKIEVAREGNDELIIFNLVREEIEIKNISYYGFVPQNSNNAYIKLSGFSRSAGDEVKKALTDLKDQRVIESIILDLRGNPGGLLDAAIDVCEKFIKKKQLVVSVQGRDSLSSKKYYSYEEPIIGDIKLAVLIDESSASASEIVAGAIQDHDRGIVVGVNSYGKGLVQTLIPLSYNTSLKITTARYYTPSGRSIQKVDYSEKNKVFEINGMIKQSQYKTDNQRIVFSAGGIKPDTTVLNKSKSILVQRLLADGMFFKFATNIYNNNIKSDFKDYSDEDLLIKFKKYLQDQKFHFVSTAEKLINQLKKAVVDENLDKKFLEQLEQAENQIDDSHSKEIEKYKDDIIASIKEELAARTNGRQGRILESLLYDKQIETAFSLLKDNNQYKKLLKIAN